MTGMIMRYPNGLKKALTLSYDDGVIQDIRFVEIVKKYGLKGTFNLNSGIWADKDYDDSAVTHRRLTKEKALKLYPESGWEIASHTITHPNLVGMPANACTYEILKDRESLEKDFGRIVRGFAYPYGTYNDTVVGCLKASGIVYARTVSSSYNFDIPTDWLVLRPTCHHADPKQQELTDKFVSGTPGIAPWLYYVWGHSYEFDFQDNWEILGTFAEKVGKHEDIWYASNIEIYDYVEAYRRLVSDTELKRVFNPSALPVWIEVDAKVYKIEPGQTISL